MLEIVIPATELFDEQKQEFIVSQKEQTLQLEHSLVSLSKWESKWCKPFLSSDKTDEEILDYIKCMTITQNVKPEVYNRLTNDNIERINAYINAPMTATTFSEEKNARSTREIVTAELIEYWMISCGIPWDYRKSHLNKLLTLIRVCNIKNSPPKKRSKRDIMSRNQALNAARRRQFNTRG